MHSLTIETHGLTRDFGAKRAVDGLSLTVPEGVVLAFLGPNGAGKSTFLRLLMGLLEPTDGTASVLGADPRKLPCDLEAERLAMGEGMLPSSFCRLRSLAALQKAASPRFRMEVLQDFCERAELSLSATFGRLSKGQKQWFLAGSALASGAKLILLDEPAEGLDPARRRDFYDRVRDYVNDNAATAVVATHVISDIERVADQVAIVADGRLLLNAPLEELREQIRAVEYPGREVLPEFGDGIEVLASEMGDGLVRALVRLNEGDEARLRRRLGPQGVFRTVGLESLYFAVTGQEGNDG